MVMKQISVQEDSSRPQVINEIDIFRKVKHENIVRFHGVQVYHVREMAPF